MKQQKSGNLFLYGVLGLIIFSIGALIFIANKPKPTPQGALALAQCLSEKGTKFYGASWCSHCKSQKELFGGAAGKLPYVECAIGNEQAKVCADAGIEGYPTWVNAKGEKVSGEQSFEALATFSGCVLEK
jgi:thiol-disulfide isomerase/thioredoxin